MPTETQAIALREADALPVWNPKQVIAQVQLVQDVMASVMKKDEHYGTIPGTKKPSLYKAGAEKLGLTFRLAPEFLITEKDLGGGHREYAVTCRLTSIQTSAFISSGVGTCSTMEAKYRYRDAQRKCPKCGQESIRRSSDEKGGGWYCWRKIGGCGVQFKAGDESIEKQVMGRSENPDIADTYNTVLKMAKKRAHVDAILTATAASDIFTQDVEDLAEHTSKVESPAGQPGGSQPSAGLGESAGASPVPGAPPAGESALSETQAMYVKIHELREGAGWTVGQLTIYVNKTFKGSNGDLTKLDRLALDALIAHLNGEQRQRTLA